MQLLSMLTESVLLVHNGSTVKLTSAHALTAVYITDNSDSSLVDLQEILNHCLLCAIFFDLFCHLINYSSKLKCANVCCVVL